MFACPAADVATALVTSVAGIAAAVVLVVREWRREPSGPFERDGDVEPGGQQGEP